MQTIIWHAASSDAAAIAELYLRARHAGSATGTVPPPAHDDDDVREWVAQVVIPRLGCWLAGDEAGNVVGMLVLEGPDRLWLWAFVSNEGAQRFYLRHGFLEVERTDGSRNEEGAPAIQYAWSPA